MSITFTLLESLRSEIYQESLSKMQLWGPKHYTKGVDQRKLRLLDILAYRSVIGTKKERYKLNLEGIQYDIIDTSSFMLHAIFSIEK